MSNIEVSKTFQERMYERVRDSIGELMSDEDLKKVVEATIQKAFFEPRVTHVTHGSYGKTEEKEAYFVEMVRELVKEQVKVQITVYFNEHEEELSKMVEENMNKGLTKIISEQIDATMHDALWRFGNSFREQFLQR